MPGEIGKRIERGSFIGREKWQRGEGTAFFFKQALDSYLLFKAHVL